MNDVSKRHSKFLSLIFILKCLSKASVIRILKRDNQLNLFRRLEQLSTKQLNCDGGIEFLRLCQNLGLTPTFAKIDKAKSIRSINQLKKRDDIVISKPDKGLGVVVMNKSDYIHLLSEASINDETKFQPVSLERPRTKGRPPKHYHPLLEKEKHLDSVVRRILPKHIADTVCLKGSRLAHLYGLPKTHKERLAMRPILSATETYNYTLAEWLDEKLKPLSVNNHTISDVFQLAEEIRELDFNEDDILVSYDVSALFTNVPLEETIQILANKAFNQNWFNETYNLNITQEDLVELLRVATKHQLFQFNGSLYEQIDGVAMGSPLGPLMALGETGERR